jgi:hypothetical protein
MTVFVGGEVVASLVYYVIKNTREHTEGDAAVMDVGT